MSPTPEQQLLLGATQALHFVMSQAEQKAALTIWNARSERKQDVIDCIMDAARAFSDAVEKCSGPKVDEGEGEGGGGQAPKCGPGMHEEFGICVPN